MGIRENRAARARELVVFLRERGAVEQGIPAREVIDEVMTRVPALPEELELLSNGSPRGVTDVRWSSATLVKAGWIAKSVDGSGGWRVTAAGGEALDEHPDPLEFFTEAQQRYRVWERDRAAQTADRLGSQVLPVDENQAKVLAAAEYFVERGLKEGMSVLAPSRPVWTAPVVAELIQKFGDAGQVPGAGFVDGLAVQLADASDDAKLLMAELVTWQMLPISHHVIGERKKSERVAKVLTLMDHPVEVPQEIRSAFVGGSFNPGPAMANNIPDAIVIMLSLLANWVELSPDEQAGALGDPAAWRDLVRRADGPNFPSQRNALMYLVHPEYFGPIVSEAHKSKIRSAFLGEIDGPSDDVEDDIFRITLALQLKAKGPARFYHDEDLRSRWFEPGVVEPEPEYVASRAEEPTRPTEAPLDPLVLPRATLELAERLHLDTDWLDQTVELLERRRQVIFYGPPGTGKTFLARALGEHIGGARATTEIVQFHPSYSYEDFFEGYRPVSDGRGGLAFELKRGPLRRIAERAANNPEYPYLLIIDEINRGNLSKIFGELYYLLEYRSDSISLLYGATDPESGEPARFSLPPNLYIIGTMNSADRSIALLDSAMRRRFAFRELHPDRHPVRDVLARWAGRQPETAGLRIPDIVAELNRRISDDAYKVGPSYFMSVRSREDLELAWETQVLPLLEELHFGEAVDVAGRYGLSRLAGHEPMTAASEHDGVGDGDRP